MVYGRLNNSTETAGLQPPLIYIYIYINIFIVDYLKLLDVYSYFTYGAPYEWNKLDERVRRLSNFNLFKSEIKTVLFLRYFNS